MKMLVHIVLLYFLPAIAEAQHVYIDSLHTGLRQPGLTIHEKVNIYNELIEVYRAEQDYGQASAYCDSLLALAKREKDYLQQTKAYVYQGIIQSNAKRYEAIPALVQLSKKSAASTQDRLASAYSEYLQGYYEYAFDDFKKAMAHLQKSLSFLEESAGDIDLEYKINYLMYGTYTEWGDEDNTFKYARQCVDLAEKSRNKNQLSNARTALAVAYTYRYDKSQREEDLRGVLDNIEQAGALYRAFPGQVAGYTYAIARNNKASYLMRYYPSLPPAIRKEIVSCINESLRISKAISDSQPTQASSLGMLSHLAIQDGQMDAAEKYLIQAYFILQTQNPVYYHTMIRVCSELASLYEQTGEPRKALNYQNR